MPASFPMASWNGMVANIIRDRMPPEMRPNVRTILLMRGLSSGKGRVADPGAAGPRVGTPPSCALRPPRRVTRTGDSAGIRAKITRSGDESGLLGELHGLRAAFGGELAEQPCGMGLHRVLAHEQPLGDLLVAQARGHGFEDVQLAWRDPECLHPGLVAHERSPARHGHL